MTILCPRRRNLMDSCDLPDAVCRFVIRLMAALAVSRAAREEKCCGSAFRNSSDKKSLHRPHAREESHCGTDSTAGGCRLGNLWKSLYLCVYGAIDRRMLYELLEIYEEAFLFLPWGKEVVRNFPSFLLFPISSAGNPIGLGIVELLGSRAYFHLATGIW